MCNIFLFHGIPLALGSLDGWSSGSLWWISLSRRVPCSKGFSCPPDPHKSLWSAALSTLFTTTLMSSPLSLVLFWSLGRELYTILPPDQTFLPGIIFQNRGSSLWIPRRKQVGWNIAQRYSRRFRQAGSALESAKDLMQAQWACKGTGKI